MKHRAFRICLCLLIALTLLGGLVSVGAAPVRAGGQMPRQLMEQAGTGADAGIPAEEPGPGEAPSGSKTEKRPLDARILAGILGALLVCALCCILAMRLQILSPLRRLTEMTGQLDELEGEELLRRAEEIQGEAGKAARAIAAYVAAEEDSAVEERVSAGSESEYKMQVVDDICRSLLPQPLKENSTAMTFAIAGSIQKGTRLNCAFYDYFFLDENTLCLVVGQVPGSGIAEAMFAVVAQTAIRSRLRMGRSLIETMSDVNSQLYDYGSRNSVSALVGVLNTVSGQFSFVNAGGTVPFLMRSEGKFEWLRTPVYAPLGANESVSYRSERLRFNQGDRLFLYTADLGEMENRDGERFRDQELQSALNRSRSRTRTMEEQLRFMQDEAAAFCESGNDVLSSAGLALEYKKGSKDYVYIVVQATAEYAPTVTEFLRKTLEERGVAAKDRARLILLGDELFALCSRVCEDEADIKVACALMPEESAVHIRMFAPMGGRDPLEIREDPAGESAASYIRAHTRRAAFEAGTDRDMAEIVSDLS